MRTYGFVLVMALLVCLSPMGCAPNTEPMERLGNRAIDEIIGPAVQKSLVELGTRTGTIQGGVQGIEPGYEVVVEGKIVNGFEGKATIRAKGVAGQFTGHLQGDSDAASSEEDSAPNE